MSIKNMIDHIASGNYNEANKAFSAEISQRTVEALDNEKRRLAGVIFNGGTVVEESHDFTDEEIEEIS